VETGQLAVSTVALVAFTVGAGEAVDTRTAVAAVTVVVARRTVSARFTR